MLKPRFKSAVDDGFEWTEDRLSSVRASNRHMFDHQDACDVVFTVKGPGDKVETRIGAHRYVLCSRSPVFYKLLWGSKSANEKKLKETDIPTDALREVIRFLYCEEARLTVSNALQVLQGSRKFQVTPLTFQCLEFVECSITASDVCSLLDQCLTLKEEDIAASCLEYIELHTPAILQSASFLTLRTEVLQKIIARDTLDVPEIDLFQACVAWARERCSPPPKDGEELRKHLEPLLPLIRFPTMQQNEFATCVVPLNVLNDSEACNIYKYFTCPEKPPKRFITLKRKRPGMDGEAMYGAGDRLYPVLNIHTPVSPSAPDLLPTPTVNSDLPPKYEATAQQEFCA